MKTKQEAYELAKKIAEILNEKKGKDIIIIDLKEKSVLADYFVIASGKSLTAVAALANNVDDKLSKEGIEPLRRDGLSEANWVVVDYGSVILHIFYSDVREYYHLERLWIDGANFEKYGDEE